ncbi:GNAT family N-acetyltransferase [Paenibacillus sp. MMS20-IR301]|uniref:GNAT family N-acetyltransferase n=1 Tax=Paenibacillus sp. MMS20-IR301 TaxID=2895946 RepID=UPI0028E6E85F|nr:GNAT family N-acetyltransferase [Paenibacillus sp. MMS20-IR301]WNS44232.1 GNAT family N-acetyltransferase [Paenibacillus sp. MMS20-IR301]
MENKKPLSPSSELIIRNAVLDDADTLRVIFRSASLSAEGGCELAAAHPEWFVWDDSMLPFVRVAVVDSLIAGFASAYPAGGFLELEDLFTDPARMRQGVASALVADLTQHGLPIEVTANRQALSFYESAGFVTTGVIETPGGPAPRMRLDVTATSL